MYPPTAFGCHPLLLRGPSHFPFTETTNSGVGFDGLGAVRTLASARQIAERTFLERALVVFNHLLDALRIPLGVTVAVNLVGPA